MSTITIDTTDMREWAIQIARLGLSWLPEAEKSRIRADLMYDLTTRADAAEGRAPRPAFAEAPNVVPFAGRRDTMEDTLRLVTGRGPDGAV